MHSQALDDRWVYNLLAFYLLSYLVLPGSYLFVGIVCKIEGRFTSHGN